MSSATAHALRAADLAPEPPVAQTSQTEPPLGPAPDEEHVLRTVRRTVRGLLEDTPAFAAASPELRSTIAHKMVEVSMLAAGLLAEEASISEDLRVRESQRDSGPELLDEDAPLATGLAAGDQFSGVAARRGAEQLEALKDAIDFPTYVRSLITGVFQAITQSSIAQLDSLNDLLGSVSASSSSFAARNVADGDAARWVVGRFPYLFTIKPGKSATDRARLVLVPEVELSEKYAALREGLEASEDEVQSIDEDELEETLVPLARRKMGRDKQAMLATMVMLGMQRIVVDQGRLHASMDMRVDTRSVAEQREQQRTDTRVSTSASGSFGYGPWAASASVSATVGFVKSDEKYSKEELATQAGLRSSVDLLFRTEQIPLDRMANDKAQERIMKNTKVPKANWTSGSLLATKSETKRAEFGKVPGAPKAPKPADPLKLAKLNPAKKKDDAAKPAPKNAGVKK